MSFKILTATFLFIAINGINATIYDPTQDHMYTYGTFDDFGPSKWHDTCKGSEQNPFWILRLSPLISQNVPKPSLDFINIDEPPKEIKVINNGFGVFFKFIYHELTAPRIYAGPLLSDLYQFDSFSYHINSEHDTDIYPAAAIYPPIEFQFMHFNLKYGTLENARDKSDGLAVIAVRYSEYHDNLGTPFPIPLLSLIGSVYHPFTEVSLTGSNLFTYSDALGFKAGLGHYTVHGSLTTPPCYESVQWFIMKINRPYNVEDLKILRNIKLWDGSTLSSNRRPLQPMHGPIYG